jgi:hypothetical protein
MEVFKLPDIKLYNIDTKLQAADVGTKRITCNDTRLSTCVLIHFSKQRYGRCAVAFFIDRVASDKLLARKAQRKIKEEEKIAAKYAYVPTIPCGGFYSKVECTTTKA